MQRIALIVIEKEEAARRGKISQPSTHSTEALGNLVRVGQVHLPAILNARRADGEFPAYDTCSVNRQREENVGVSDIAVIEVISCARLERIRIDGPSAQRNGDSELRFFVALAVKRNEGEILSIHELNHRPGCGQQRRRLVEVPIKGAKHPV